jgi:glucose dehydrogenase
VHAYDATSGKELWSHNNGLGHQGGIISYAAGGKQYIAMTAGFGGMLTDGWGDLFGGVFNSMPRDEGMLVVYAVK